MFIKSDGPPLAVEIYTDGRTHVTSPTRSLHILALVVMFKKSLDRGEFNSMRPGVYNFNAKQTGRKDYEVTLSPRT